MEKISVAIIGLGSRGLDSYAPYALKYPSEIEIVAVAEPRKERIDKARKLFAIDSTRCFSSGEELLKNDRLADAVIIATPDRTHVSLAIKALEKNYHILLEKPISPLEEECKLLLEKAKSKNRIIAICHVLRYTPFYREIKRLLDDKAIGKLESIDAIEHVGYWHMAHSFIRGNWRNSEESSSMLLQKSCHDMDILRYLVDSPFKSIHSFGSLDWFKSSNAPVGAARRCLDGCKAKANCPFDAEKIYITNKRTGIRANGNSWPCNVLATDPTEEKIYKALKTGPYGRCVYYSDNDVVDHQVVSILFENNVTASFTMTGFTYDNHRTIKLFGTSGELEGDMEENTLILRRFGEEEKIIKLEDTESGHGGGDEEIMKEFLSAVRGQGSISSSLDVSIDSHMMVFEAEKDRKRYQ